jgi:hypothetical protein
MSDDSYVQEIRYTADVRDVQSKMDALATGQDNLATNTANNTSKMSAKWSAVAPAMKAVTVGLGLVGGAALLAAPKILDAGAGLVSLDQKAKTVFGDSIGTVNAWSSANASAMGLTKSGARDAAAAMADLLKPMGFTAEQAAGMSTSMLDLSGALSAWTGGSRSAAEVSDILSKAMLGERDGLKELGISISEADVQARLAKNGTDGLTGAALEQAKALATQQLILEKSTDAQTAWSDGSMDAAKKQNQMKAATAQAGESFTRLLYPALAAIVPAVAAVTEWVGEKLPEGFRAVIGFIDRFSYLFIGLGVGIAAAAVAIGVTLVPAFLIWAAAAAAAAAATLLAAAPFIAIGAAIAAVAAGLVWAYQNFEAFRNVVNTVKDFIVGDLVPALQQIWSFISANIIPIIRTLIEVYLKVLVTYFGTVRSIIMNGVIPAFQAVASTISTVATAVWTAANGIRDAVTAARDWVKDRIDTIVGFATSLPGRVSGLFGGMWDGIKNSFRTVIKAVAGIWNSLEFTVPSLSVFGKTIGGFEIGTKDINVPALAAGGLAYAPTLAIVGDNRSARTDPEVIAPLSKLTDLLRQTVGSSFPTGPITLIIEGRPFTAMIAEHEQAQVAQLMAGAR